MHTYRKIVDDDRHAEVNSWAVGYWHTKLSELGNWARTEWITVKTFQSEAAAALFTNYLNGGIGQPWEARSEQSSHSAK